MEEFAEYFSKELKKEFLYTGAEIREIINEGRANGIGFPYENPMAYTYNRWNKGMNDIAPHLVYLWNGKYQHIGFDQKYSGSIYHVPGKEEDRYVIGEFVDGNYILLDGYSTFKDWANSDFDGNLAGDVGKKIKVLFDGVKDFKIILVGDEENSTINSSKGYSHVKISSNLGCLLVGKSKGDKFEYAGHDYVILEVKN